MRLALPLLLLVALLLAAIALDAPPPRADLTTGYISLETLDPQMMRAAYDIRVGYATFEGLCTYDPQTFTVQPGVAESWDVSDDGLTYTFHLRDDARWSDGSPVTTHDFITAWRLALLPDTAPPYSEFLHAMKGAGAFAEWAQQSLAAVNDAPRDQQRRLAEQRIAQMPEKFREIVGVRATDDRTLIVELQRPMPYFLDIVATWVYFPLPAHVIEQHTQLNPATWMYQRDPNWIKPQHIVCNGPYVPTRWRFKNELVLNANKHYHAAHAVASQTVRMIWFSDELAMFNAYESGVLDVMLGAGPLDFCAELIEAQRDGIRNDVHGFSAFGTYYYAYNCRPQLLDGSDNPFADVRVRRAFSLVIDKQALVEQVTRLRQDVSDVFIPPGSIAGYESPTGVPNVSDAANPEQRAAMIARAQQLLAEAGYPDGRGLPTIALSHNTGGGHELVAQAMKSMWETHLGVTVAIDQQEWKIFLNKRKTGDFMLARSGWFGDYGDPTTFLDLFQSDNGNNDTGHADERYDAMLTQAAAELDATQRMALLEQAEAYLLNDRVPMLPLYQYKIVHLYDPEKVTGISTHPRNLQMFHHVEVQRD